MCIELKEGRGMREGRASRTAEHNALFRALETLRRPGDRLVDEPLAAAFLSRDLRAVVLGARALPVHAAVLRIIDGCWPGVRTSVVARTRLIDDTIATIIDDVAQVVVLGAGFDTRPYRLPSMRSKAVFEVDHPDTQRRKRERLAGRRVPCDHVRYAATDFVHDGLGATLAAAGYDPSIPALVIWEGVTNYLDDHAVDTTLRWCGASAPGSHLVFTYIDRQVLDDPGRYAGAERVLSTLRRAGESMTFGLDPKQVEAYLAARGLALEFDLGAADYRRRYFGPLADRMVGHEFYRVVHAGIIGHGTEDRHPPPQGAV
jgi:methyltransferase (TIGR00027 family)